MTEHFWNTLRFINFGILFVTWMVTIYKGVFHIITETNGFDWARFMNFCWITLCLYGIGEILYEDNIKGGYRIILTLVVGLFQLYVCIFKFARSGPGKPRVNDSEL